MNNLDTRILKTADGRPALIYTFFNNTTIVLTTTDQALPDLVGRIIP